MNYYRHGDLGFTPLTKIPDNLKKVYKGQKFVLAEGEKTGHKHVLVLDKPNTAFEILQDNQGRHILKLEKDAKLSHQEHKTITIEKGMYLVQNEKEYNYFQKEIQRVQD